MMHPVGFEAEQWQPHLRFALEGQPFGGPGEEGRLKSVLGVGGVGTSLAKGEVRKLLP